MSDLCQSTDLCRKVTPQLLARCGSCGYLIHSTAKAGQCPECGYVWSMETLLPPSRVTLRSVIVRLGWPLCWLLLLAALFAIKYTNLSNSSDLGHGTEFMIYASVIIVCMAACIIMNNFLYCLTLKKVVRLRQSNMRKQAMLWIHIIDRGVVLMVVFMMCIPAITFVICWGLSLILGGVHL